MENLEDEIREDIWNVKMGKIGEVLIKDGIIQKYNRLEGNIRIKDDNKIIMIITYSQSQDKFYIRLKDNFYKKEENKTLLNNIIKSIKEIDKNQEVLVF